MGTFFAVIIAIVVFIAIYVLFLRSWLKSLPFMAWFFRLIEPVESALFKKSETILWARLQSFLGLLGIVLPTIGAFDVSPFVQFVDEKYRAIVAALPGICLALNGLITEALRRMTTKPLEVVAAPDVKPPEVQAAIEKADAATAAAVRQVEIAKVEAQ